MERRTEAPVAESTIDGARTEGVPAPAGGDAGDIRCSQGSTDRAVRAGESKNALPGRVSGSQEEGE